MTDHSFNLWARWNYAARLNAEGWTVEARVLWRDLKVQPAAGRILGFNPCRFRILANQFYCWSTVGSFQKDPALYGHMVLGDPPADLLSVLERLYPRCREMTIEVPQGDKVIVYDRGKAAAVTWRELVEARISAADAALANILAKIEQRTGTSEAESKTVMSALQECRAALAAARAEAQALAHVDEAASARILTALAKVTQRLRILPWTVKTMELMESFSAEVLGNNMAPAASAAGDHP